MRSSSERAVGTPELEINLVLKQHVTIVEITSQIPFRLAKGRRPSQLHDAFSRGESLARGKKIYKVA